MKQSEKTLAEQLRLQKKKPKSHSRPQEAFEVELNKHKTPFSYDQPTNLPEFFIIEVTSLKYLTLSMTKCEKQTHLGLELLIVQKFLR